MSDAALAALQSRVEALTAENTSLKAENKDRRIKFKKLSEEMEPLRKQVADLATERDTFKSRAEAGPRELSEKIASLEGTLRSRDHRDAFASVGEFEAPGKDGKTAKYKLADGVKPESVWQLTQYKAEGETPDAKVVSAKYAEALQSHPYLFAEATAPAPGGATRPITVPARESGPGGGRGTSLTTTTAAAQIDASYGDRPTGRIA